MLIFEISLDELNKEWEIIKDIFKLRNIIVHNNGNLMTDDDLPIEKQKEYSLVNKYQKMIMINYMSYVVIVDERLIFFFIENIDAFFKKLIKKIESNNFRELDDDFKWEPYPF